MALAQKILLIYLRRYPQRLRVSQFNFLMKYAWMGNILAEIKPELFPEEKKEEVVEEVFVDEPTEEVIQILDSTISGRKGNYKVDRWLKSRGQGFLFQGSRIGTDDTVIIKEYLLNARLYNDLELRQRQKTFENVAGLALADGRMQDLRLVTPIEAIADSHVTHRCYLVSEPVDGSVTLRQKLREAKEPYDPLMVREILSQALQTLSLLHEQKFNLQSGQTRSRLGHSNISLDSLLFVESQEKFYIYLTDLAIWENIFLDPAQQAAQNSRRSMRGNRPGAEQRQDLKDLGQVALALLHGRADHGLDPKDDNTWISVSAPLKEVMLRLLAVREPYESAVEARHALLSIPTDEMTLVSVGEEPEVEEKKPSRLKYLWLLLGLLSASGLAFFFYSRRAAKLEVAPIVLSPCCLREIDALPSGEFKYASVRGGSWSYVLSHEDVGRPGWSFKDHLYSAYPDMILNHQPSLSVRTVITLVRLGMVDFGIIPLIYPLPQTIDHEIIAYDGLGIFVAFNYSQRSEGLPSSLKGSLTTDKVQELYRGKITNWKELGATDLDVNLYAPVNLKEAQEIFDHFILDNVSYENLTTLDNVELAKLPIFEMLRSIIRDFEEPARSEFLSVRQTGGIGFAPISWIFGQCSVYPLAIKNSDKGGPAVQPLAMQNGDPITPSTDLCDQKGLYEPDSELFMTNQYPLAYPLAVIFPRDNSLVPIGKKVSEALQTDEGQWLLREAGMIPAAAEADINFK